MFDLERPANVSSRRQQLLNQDQTQVINEEEEYAEIDDAESGRVKPKSPETPQKHSSRDPKRAAQNLRMKHSSMPAAAPRTAGRHNAS